MAKDMEPSTLEYRAKESRRGSSVWLIALLAVTPAIAYAALLAFRVIRSNGNPLWLILAYAFVVGAFGIARSKARAGDRIVLKNRNLYIYRGDKLKEMISVGRITGIEHIGSKVLIRQHHELITLEKGNYEPETWAALKDGLDAFFADKSPIVGAIKTANKPENRAPDQP